MEGFGISVEEGEGGEGAVGLEVAGKCEKESVDVEVEGAVDIGRSGTEGGGKGEVFGYDGWEREGVAWVVGIHKKPVFSVVVEKRARLQSQVFASSGRKGDATYKLG